MHFRVHWHTSSETSLGSLSQGLLIVEFSLLHNNFKGRHLIFAEIHRRGWHVSIHHISKKRDIPCSILLDSVNKAYIFCWTINVKLFNLLVVILDIINLNVNESGLFVCNFLLEGDDDLNYELPWESSTCVCCGLDPHASLDLRNLRWTQHTCLNIINNLINTLLCLIVGHVHILK